MIAHCVWVTMYGNQIVYSRLCCANLDHLNSTYTNQACSVSFVLLYRHPSLLFSRRQHKRIERLLTLMLQRIKIHKRIFFKFIKIKKNYYTKTMPFSVKDIIYQQKTDKAQTNEGKIMEQIWQHSLRLLESLFLFLLLFGFWPPVCLDLLSER